MLAARAHSLAQGASGVRLELIERLLQLLGAGVLPAFRAADRWASAT